jgi:LAO/AO transport system kinase
VRRGGAGGTREVDVPALVAQARDGRAGAVARLISLVEDAHPALREVMAALAPDTGRATVVGLTGAPGVGKSTTTSALVGELRKAGRRVGVLAVDPSSPFSGGALLGDRVRMQEHALDDGVYIRSMASRGHLGGLAWATPQALRVLDAAGCDVVLVETVGVGQSEVDVAALADTTVVLLAPGMGDGIQAAKAGILEVGDVLVVNKADRDGADATGPRPAAHARARRAPRAGGLAAAGGARRRDDRRGAAGRRRGARQAPRLAGGGRPPGASPRPPRGRRGRGDRAHRAARPARRPARRAAARRRWPPRWSPAAPTPTRPPTGCSRAWGAASPAVISPPSR